MVHPQSKLKFNIIVERLDGHQIIAGTNNLYGPAGTGVDYRRHNYGIEVLDNEESVPVVRRGVHDNDRDDLGAGRCQPHRYAEVDSYFRSLPTMRMVLAT